MILEAIGENPEREGLLETPSRIAGMYAEMTPKQGQSFLTYRCLSILNYYCS